MILLIHHDVLAVIGTIPTLHVRLDVWIFRILRVRRLADVVLVHPQRMIAGRHLAAARMIVGPFERLQLFRRVQLLARFEQQHFHPLRSQDVRGHSARRSRPNHNRVVNILEVNLRTGRVWALHKTLV